MDKIEKVYAYLDNDLSPEDRASFENDLKNDVSLQKELKFQTEVIEGIKSVRKAELKAALNAVPVTGSVISTGQYITGFMVAVLLSAGLFYFWPTEETGLSSGPSIELPSETENIEQRLEDPINSKKENTDTIIEEEKETATSVVEPSKEIEATTSDIQETKEREVTTNPTSITTPEIPQIANNDIESEDSTNPVNNLIQNSVPESETFQITVVNDDKYTFHYQFKDSKLYLYGQFDDTYEILDFNMNNDRALYLFTKGKYHPLDVNTKKVTELNPVKDRTLISELEDLRKK